MKVIKVAFGFIIGITSISLIVIGVYSLTKGTPENIDSIEFQVTNVTEDTTFYTHNIDKINELHNFTLEYVNKGSYNTIKLYNNGIYINDVILEYLYNDIYTYYITDINTDVLIEISLSDSIITTYKDYGLTITQNDILRLDVITNAKPAILSGNVAILIGLIPLLFVGGVIVNRYNNMEI